LNRHFKWALVTGASRGIGAAIARILSENSYNVLLLARNEALLREVSREIIVKGGHARWLGVDLTSEADLKKLREWARNSEIRFSLLVLNAGIAKVGKVLEMSMEDWRKVLEVNLLSPVALIKNLESFITSPGQLIFINSAAGKTAFAEWGAYCASKFALRAVADTLRAELAEKNIRVTSVYPSSVNTPMHDELSLPWDRSKMLKPEDVAKAVLAATEFSDNVNVNDITVENISGKF